MLDAIERWEISSQRQLAGHTGISVGKINYLLRELLAKGLVKMGNFKRNSAKIDYTYVLTRKGLEAKSRAAARFVNAKLEEYNDLEFLRREADAKSRVALNRFAPRCRNPADQAYGNLIERGNPCPLGKVRVQ